MSGLAPQAPLTAQAGAERADLALSAAAWLGCMALGTFAARHLVGLGAALPGAVLGAAMGRWSTPRARAWLKTGWAVTSSPWARAAWVGLCAVAGLLSRWVVPWELAAEGPAAWRALLWAADAVSVGLLTFGFTAWVASRPSATATAVPGRFSWLAYALPCALVWTLYLLAFWPAIMTRDSVEQWGQLDAFRIGDNHPAFHTLLEWLLTRGFRSPAVVAGFQIAIQSAAVGLCAAELRRHGCSRWVMGCTTAAFALFPASGILAVTLWKDVPYTAAVLLLWAILLRLLRSDGRWLDSPVHAVVLAVPLALVSLLRHNGPAVSVAFVACIALAWRARWRGLLGSAAVALALVGLVRGPLYRAAQVTPMDRYFALQLQTHQLGAFLRAGVVDPEDRAYLATVQPLESWERNYDCASLNPLVWNSQVRREVVEQDPGRYASTWLRLARRHPAVLLEHLACVTSYVWLIDDPQARLYAFNVGIDPNPLGLESRSVLPRFREALIQFARWTTERAQAFWAWRPALYLYWTVLVSVGLALRARRLQPLLLMLPSVVTAGVLLVMMPSPDFRYLFPVYAVGMLMPAAVFTRPCATTAQAPAR